MSAKPYGLLCPISRASQLLEPRWTIPILTEIWAGATRFNTLRRRLGSISPGVLSRRLSELEAHGLVERFEDKATGTIDYFRTPKSEALEPVIKALGVWAQQNIEAELALAGTLASPLMWKFQSVLKVDALPEGRSVIRFHFRDEPSDYDTFWFLAQRGAPPELCVHDPELDVDLYVEATLVAMGGMIMGRTTLARETDRGTFFLSGDPRLARTFQDWLPPGPYAKVPDILPLAGA
ncbi:MAG: helix-turn-helix domain-containing protein [Pseudomonadota bacterium]